MGEERRHVVLMGCEAGVNSPRYHPTPRAPERSRRSICTTASNSLSFKSQRFRYMQPCWRVEWPPKADRATRLFSVGCLSADYYFSHASMNLQ